MALTTGVVLVVEQLRQPAPGGIGTYCRGLLQGLRCLVEQDGAQVGLDLELVASRPPGGPDPLEAWGWPLRTSRLPRQVLGEAWRRGLLGLPGGRGARVRHPVVHACSLAAPWREARRGRSLVVTVHDLAWRRHPETYPPRGRRWHEAALAQALVHARALVVPSGPVAEDLRRAGFGGPVVVVPHGADHLPPPDEQATAAWLAAAGVAGPFLMTVGTLEPRKNLGRVLAAFRGAREDLAGVPWLVVVGPAGWGRALPGAPEELGPGVVLAGSVPAPVLAGLYQRAVALVYAPLEEGFGLPPLEAMAAGTPVVASAVPSVDEEVAVVVDPWDVGDLRRAMVQVASDAELRARLVSAGSRRAATRTWREVAVRHRALWEEVAG